MFTHTIYACIGYVIIPKPHCSRSEGINSRCRRLGSICRRYGCCRRRSCCRWRSIDRDRSQCPFSTDCALLHSTDTCARGSVFAIALICRCVIRNCVRSRATSRQDILHSKHSGRYGKLGRFVHYKTARKEVSGDVLL